MERPGKVLHISAILRGLRLTAPVLRVRCEPGWSLGPGWSDRLRDYDLWAVWAGSGRMRTSDGDALLEPGVVVWMRPGRLYEAVQDPRRRLGVSAVHFELTARPRWRPPFEVMRTAELAFLDAALRRVVTLRRRPDASSHETARVLFATVLAQLAREAAEPTEAGVESHHRIAIGGIVAAIEESPGDTPGVAELARRAGYSVDHFSRLFTRVTGLGPEEFAIRARVERARHLLRETDLGVGQIAAALGYRDIFYFSRQFRQRTGMSPLAWRRSAGQRAPAQRSS